MNSSEKCPFCDSTRVYHIRRDKLKCGNCRKEWSPRFNTELAGTKVLREKGQRALELMEAGADFDSIRKETRLSHIGLCNLFERCRVNFFSRSWFRKLKLDSGMSLFAIAEETEIGYNKICRIFAKSANYIPTEGETKAILLVLRNHSFRNTGGKQSESLGTDLKPEEYETLENLSENLRRGALTIIKLLECCETGIPRDFFTGGHFKTGFRESRAEKLLKLLIEAGFISQIENKLYLLKRYDEEHLSERIVRQNLNNLAYYFMNVSKDYYLAYKLYSGANNKKRLDDCFIRALWKFEDDGEYKKIKETLANYHDKVKRANSTIIFYRKYYQGELQYYHYGNIARTLASKFSFLNYAGFFDSTEYKKILNDSVRKYNVLGSVITIANCLNFVGAFNTKESLNYYIDNICNVDKDALWYPFFLLSSAFSNIHLNNNEIASKKIHIAETFLQENADKKTLFASLIDRQIWLQFNLNNKKKLNIIFKNLEQNDLNDFEPSWKWNTGTFYGDKYIIDEDYFTGVILFTFLYVFQINNNNKKILTLFYIRLCLEGILHAQSTDSFEKQFESAVKKIPRYFYSGHNVKKLLAQFMEHFQISLSLKLESIVSKLIHGIDSRMVNIQKHFFSNSIKKSLEYEVFSKIITFDKKISGADFTDSTHILSLLKQLSIKKYHDKVSNLYANSVSNLFNYYFRLYEKVFLPEKIVSSIFPIPLADYEQRFIDRAIGAKK